MALSVKVSSSIFKKRKNKLAKIKDSWKNFGAFENIWSAETTEVTAAAEFQTLREVFTLSQSVKKRGVFNEVKHPKCKKC